MFGCTARRGNVVPGALIPSSAGVARPVAAGENDDAGRQAPAKLEDDWARPLEAHDTFLARVLAPDFHGTEDSAKTLSRGDVLQDAADTAVQLRDLHDEDRQVRLYGNGTPPEPQP
jgi:hypothetical protein